MPTRRQRNNKKSRRNRRQRGGGWGFDGSSVLAAGGVPLESRVMMDDCSLPARVAPQLGGGCGCMRLDPSTQTGGGCGACMFQRGGGGYSVNVGSHDLGKVATYMPGSCQRGGFQAPLDYSLVGGQKAHVSASEISAHTANYSSINPVELPDGSRYMNVVATGGRRNRSRRNGRKTTRRW